MHTVEAKGILSAHNGMNVYRGCQHGCIYCDTRSKFGLLPDVHGVLGAVGYVATHAGDLGALAWEKKGELLHDGCVLCVAATRGEAGRWGERGAYRLPFLRCFVSACKCRACAVKGSFAAPDLRLPGPFLRGAADDARRLP